MHVDLFFFVFLLFFFCDFPIDFSLLFSLSLSSYFPFCWAFISYFCFGLAYSLRHLAGLLKKDKVKVDFQNSIFQIFFWHSKASGVLPVCFSRLILRAYKVMVLAHTKKSTLTDSVNKKGC